MNRPRNWIEFVNETERESELENLRASAQRSRPFGNENWESKLRLNLGLNRRCIPVLVRSAVEKTPDPFSTPLRSLIATRL